MVASIKKELRWFKIYTQSYMVDYSMDFICEFVFNKESKVVWNE